MFPTKERLWFDAPNRHQGLDILMDELVCYEPAKGSHVHTMG